VFTGLVQAIGTVTQVFPQGPDRPSRIVIRPAPPSGSHPELGRWGYRPDPGDSISISGCCLTLAAILPDASSATDAPPHGSPEANAGFEGPAQLWAFDVVPETLRRTTLGGLRPGDPVNLEHAVTASTLMGGHFVQGHIDGVGSVVDVQRGADWRLKIRPPEPDPNCAGDSGAAGTSDTVGDASIDLMRFAAPKGSICIDGVSLTIAGIDVQARTIGVALIPVTLARTTLGRLAPGDRVNLEMDILAKTVVHYLSVYGRS
jgi:riboflavin synthase